MIEIRKAESDTKQRLFLNEVEIQQIDVHCYGWDGDRYKRYCYIKIYGFENAIILSQQQLKDFPALLTLKFRNWLDLSNFYIAIDIDTVAYINSKPDKFVKGKNTVIILKIIPYLENWNFPYSFNDYKIEFNKEWIEDLRNDIDEIDWVSKSQNILLSFNSIEFERSLNKTFLTDFSNETISEVVKPFVETILDCHNKTIDNLKFFKDNNSLSLLFDFPEELKVPCEQYLLYFAQFLQDLGISTTSNLKEEAGKVLFSVTPTDDIEALDKIREALAVYLNLPSSPVLYNDSFQSMHLKQQVENLQHSQRMKEMEMRSAQYALRLAQQNIENQDKIIVQQNSFIDNQNEIIEKITSKSVMIDSLENKEEIEEIYEGVKVGESKWLKELTGIGLNPAKAIKTAVKNTFGKDERKSVLGLDEETSQEDKG